MATPKSPQESDHPSRRHEADVTARYDNSANNPNNPNDPPKRVMYGEQTTDEMCVCFFEYLSDSQEQANAMRKQIMRSMVASAIARKIVGK